MIGIICKHIAFIVSEINTVSYQAIADEVTDVANKEQLSLCLRCVHYDHVKEVFLDFVEVERITGIACRHTISVLDDSLVSWAHVRSML